LLFASDGRNFFGDEQRRAFWKRLRKLEVFRVIQSCVKPTAVAAEAVHRDRETQRESTHKKGKFGGRRVCLVLSHDGQSKAEETYCKRDSGED
jgi:hypothetical protein